MHDKQEFIEEKRENIVTERMKNISVQIGILDYYAQQYVQSSLEYLAEPQDEKDALKLQSFLHYKACVEGIYHPMLNILPSKYCIKEY